MVKKTTKVPKIEIIEIDEGDEEEEVYYANIFEATEILRNIVTLYYNGKNQNNFDMGSLEEEYKKMGIYNIYDYGRYLINNKIDLNLLLEIENGKKIKLKNIKFPRF